MYNEEKHKREDLEKLVKEKDQEIYKLAHIGKQDVQTDTSDLSQREIFKQMCKSPQFSQLQFLQKVPLII